MIHTIKLRNFI